MNLRVLLLALVVLSSCVTARAEIVGTAHYDPRPDTHPVCVFDSLEDVPQPYVKVAVIYAEGDGMTSWERILERMKQQARLVGADALVLRTQHTEVAAVTEYGISRRKNKSAIAIRLSKDGD